MKQGRSKRKTNFLIYSRAYLKKNLPRKQSEKPGKIRRRTWDMQKKSKSVRTGQPGADMSRDGLRIALTKYNVRNPVRGSENQP